MLKKTNFKKPINLSITTIGIAFGILSIIAKIKKSDSVYENQPNEKNYYEGKRVQFVANDNGPMNADGFRGYLEVIGDNNYQPNVYEKYIKRLLDIVLSFFGLVILCPLLVCVGIAIKIEDHGPILFVQKRVGVNKQFFKIHKFRSMKVSAPKEVPTHMIGNSNNYMTSVGKVIRAYSIDELPQMWDVFIGNMSVVGPRPSLWNQDVLISERDKYHANEIKPGLTGWAQINGRDEIDIYKKASLDGEYVKKTSFLMDAKVFFCTIKYLFCEE